METTHAETPSRSISRASSPASAGVRVSTATAPSDDDYRSYYTSALVDTVYARYREDFEVLGWHGAREELLGYLR